MERERRNILASYGDGAAYSLMVGFGETYLAAFALAAGLGQVTAGLLGTVPYLAGGLLQLLGPYGMRLVGSYRRWVVTCATVQGLVYLPLAVAAWIGVVPAPFLYAFAALYWCAGLAAGPAWNNWIEMLVPGRRLREFLAVRSRITQIAAFLAFLAGGYLLQVWQADGQVLHGFMILFALAGLGRFASAGFLSRQDEAAWPTENASQIPLAQIARRLLDPQCGRFLLFLLVSQVAVNIAGPFFSPYMLARLHLSYAAYAALISASYVAKITFYPYVARFVRHVGPYRALRIAAIGVAPGPLFWFLTPHLAPLMAVQIYAGVAWAAFELSSTLLVFDRVAKSERIRILTVYNLLNAAAIFVGSLGGGLLLSRLASTEAYAWVFTLSSSARFASLGVLFGIKDVRVKMRRIAFRTLSLRPGHGSLAQPILIEQKPENHKKRYLTAKAVAASARESEGPQDEDAPDAQAQ